MEQLLARNSSRLTVNISGVSTKASLRTLLRGRRRDPPPTGIIPAMGVLPMY